MADNPGTGSLCEDVTHYMDGTVRTGRQYRERKYFWDRTVTRRYVEWGAKEQFVASQTKGGADPSEFVRANAILPFLPPDLNLVRFFRTRR